MLDLYPILMIKWLKSLLIQEFQLNLQMVAGLSFQYYSEARINFMPTYKFDFGNDVYDSS